MAPTVTVSQDAVKIGSEEQMLTTAHVWSTQRCLTGARAGSEVSNCHSYGTWCWWGQQEMEVSGGKYTHVTGPSLIECWFGRRIIPKRLMICYVFLYWFILTCTTKLKGQWNTRNYETQALSIFLHLTKTVCPKRLRFIVPCVSPYRWVHVP